MGSQYAHIVRHVEKLAPAWQSRIGLDHFTIQHAFLDSFLGDDGEDDFKVTAVTEVRWNYLEAKIKWYLPSAVRHSLDHIEDVLVHELVHVLLAPEQALLDLKLEQRNADEAMTEREYESLQDLFYERMEMATEMTARALLRTYREGNS